MDARGPFRNAVSRLAWQGISLTGLPWAARVWNRRRALIVMYHGVVPDGRPYHNWGQLPESKFRRQLESLARRHRVLPLGQIVAAIRDGLPLPPNAAAITFDDGFANNAHVAWPHLKALGLPATIFLVTGHVGTKRLLWPDEVFLLLWHAVRRHVDLPSLGLPRIDQNEPRRCGRAYRQIVTHLKRIPAERKNESLAALRSTIGSSADESPWAGDFQLMTWDDVARLNQTGLVEFGAHTGRHDILTQLPPDEAYREIRESIAAVCARSNRDDVPFAYPNGAPCDFSPAIVDMVRDAGASCAVTTVEGLNPMGSDPFTLRRISVGADLSHHNFELRCSGVISALRRARGCLVRRRPVAEPASMELLAEAESRPASSDGVRQPTPSGTH